MSHHLETMLMMCAKDAVSSAQGHAFIASLPRQPDLDLPEHKRKELFTIRVFRHCSFLPAFSTWTLPSGERRTSGFCFP